jgi:hypothetical protein
MRFESFLSGSADTLIVMQKMLRKDPIGIIQDDVVRIDRDALIIDFVDPGINRDSHYVDSRIACHSQCQAIGTSIRTDMEGHRASRASARS